MKKPGKLSSIARTRASRKPSTNAVLNRQTRRVLVQHYRAKHGVK
jgi:hypothetical protein